MENLAFDIEKQLAYDTNLIVSYLSGGTTTYH